MYNCLKRFKRDLWSIMDHYSSMAAFPFEVVLWSMTGAMRSVLNGPTKTECAKVTNDIFTAENWEHVQVAVFHFITICNWSDAYFAHRHPFPGKLATITRIKEKLPDSWRYHILKAANFDFFDNRKPSKKGRQGLSAFYRGGRYYRKNYRQPIYWHFYNLSVNYRYRKNRFGNYRKIIVIENVQLISVR